MSPTYLHFLLTAVALALLGAGPEVVRSRAQEKGIGAGRPEEHGSTSGRRPFAKNSDWVSINCHSEAPEAPDLCEPAARIAVNR